MKKKSFSQLSRRERQIMDIIFQNGNATAADVQKQLPDPPGYSSVRALLRVLEEKGYLKHKMEGPRYVYSSTIAREKAKNTALKHMMQTFFNGSTEKAVAALLDMSSSELSREEWDRLSKMIENARREEK